MITDTTIIAELKRIADESGGELKPDAVVSAARDGESPLHKHFEWNDSRAAQSHRTWQARQLIRVVVTYVGSDEKKVPMRVFVSLTSDRGEDGAGYRATAAVLANADHRAQLMSDALQEMKSFQTKYAALKELAETFASMKAAEKRLLQKVGFTEEAA